MPAETHSHRAPLDRDTVALIVREQLAEILEVDIEAVTPDARLREDLDAGVRGQACRRPPGDGCRPEIAGIGEHHAIAMDVGEPEQAGLRLDRLHAGDQEERGRQGQHETTG